MEPTVSNGALPEIVSMPWQVRLCLEHGFEFQTQGEGRPTLYSLDFFAHIHGVRDVSTIRMWVKKRNIRHKKFVSILVSEADFADAFEWINAEG